MMAAAIAAALAGCFIGSFLNVVVHRVPAGRSVIRPRSACPRCGHAIRWYDNLPVISWLVLAGRCRDCRAPISVRYPLAELGTAALFAAVTIWLGPKVAAADSMTSAVSAVLELLAFLYLAAISLVLALIDLDTRRLPNVIVLPSYLVGAVLLGTSGILRGDLASLVSAAAGMLALGGFYLVLALAVPGGMGFGDVKLAGLLGLFLGWLGWAELAVGAFAAFLLGGAFAIALLIVRRARRRSAMPFGPWMLSGAWLGVFAAGQIAAGYLDWSGLSSPGVAGA